MRPFEFHALHYYNLLNERISSRKKSIGLLCSFQGTKIGDKKVEYSGNAIKSAIRDLCTKLKWNFDVIGEKQNSLDWMSEVLKLILKNDYLIVDVTHQRPNVLYELGIACSFRDADSVIITINKNVKFESSEVLQLQCLRYDDIKNLVEQLLDHFDKDDDIQTIEEEQQFNVLHRKLSPGAMNKLFSMLNSHFVNYQTRKANVWHISFDLYNPCNWKEIDYAEELIRMGLARYEYDPCKIIGTLPWALHPTDLGKRYIRSDRFFKLFIPGNEIDDYMKLMVEIDQVI